MNAEAELPFDRQVVAVGVLLQPAIQFGSFHDAANPTKRRHSADVQMELRLNGHSLPISQLGPDFLILSAPADHPPADAEIMLSIDGHEDRWSVRLVDGIAAGRHETRLSPCVSVNGAASD